MTGNYLKNSIKTLGLTQSEAAEKLGVTRATLNNWCKLAVLPAATVANVKTSLGIDFPDEPTDDAIHETLRSQQRTIEELTGIIKNLTSKNE